MEILSFVGVSVRCTKFTLTVIKTWNWDNIIGFICMFEIIKVSDLIPLVQFSVAV